MRRVRKKSCPMEANLQETMRRYNFINTSTNPAKLARLLVAVGEWESGLWLQVLPALNIGSILDDLTCRLAACLRLSALYVIKCIAVNAVGWSTTSESTDYHAAEVGPDSSAFSSYHRRNASCFGTKGFDTRWYQELCPLYPGYKSLWCGTQPESKP